MAHAVADIFRQAAKLNKTDSRRKGNIVKLDEGCDVIVSGDIHGNRSNLTKIINHANLSDGCGRRLVLQEIIHGPPDPKTGHDRSIELLMRVAREKVAHNEEVLFILGNHEIAQVTGNEITKNGIGVCKDFEQSVSLAFGEDTGEIMLALYDFILSMPLAIRCPGGAFITHSLPSPNRMEMAGDEIFSRSYEPPDLQRGGALYEWTWGRSQTPQQIDNLAQQLGVNFFILGHRRIEAGYEIISDRGICLAADHEHGHIMEFPSDVELNGENVTAYLKPVVALKK